MVRVLVCGDREWSDAAMIEATLAELYEMDPGLTIIEGRARGADQMAGRYADVEGIAHERYPPEWERYRRGAGPKRNQQMLDSGVDLVIAFHDDLSQSAGTADMVRRARNAGVPVWIMHGASPQTTPDAAQLAEG